jgi:hypothetical protein
LEAIKQYIGAQNKVQNKKNKVQNKNSFYLLEVYRKSIFDFLNAHFIKYPLLGEKK